MAKKGVGTNHTGQHRPGRHAEGQAPRESKSQPRQRGKAVGRASVPDSSQDQGVKGLLARAVARLAAKKK